MNVNMTITDSAPIYTYDESSSQAVKLNSFVPSQNAAFVLSYEPPPLDLNTIRYANLSPTSVLATTTNYIPTMIPGGDYSIATYEDNLYLKLDGDATMSADRCRQAWRLSHYVRKHFSGSITDDPVIKIAYNTAAALVYNASKDTGDPPNYIPVIPGRLTLDVNTYNLTNGYGGYSGDMVPPLLALIDAFTSKGMTWETTDQPIPVYSEDIKKLNHGQNTLNAMETALTGGSSTVYPTLDSITSGGQQYGLGGCGFICTLDFLSRPNFDVMLKYDNLTGWGQCSSYTRPTDTKFSTQELLEMIQVYKTLGFRGNGFQTYEEWPTKGMSGSDNGNYATLILSKAYFVNIRIRDINVTMEDEMSFGPNEQGQANGVQYYLYTGDGIVSYNPGNASPYVYTDFPMYGIPDSGWGSITVEIFSYLGIMFVGMNDYANFCKWHRTFWHLLFIQNGGDMYG
jgi:hypothetical protein